MRTKCVICILISLFSSTIKTQISDLVRMTRFWNILQWHRARTYSEDGEKCQEWIRQLSPPRDLTTVTFIRHVQMQKIESRSYLIQCARRLSEITVGGVGLAHTVGVKCLEWIGQFPQPPAITTMHVIRQAQIQKIGKPNKLRVLGSK